MIIFIRTIILYALVIIVMRLMGKRQIGQLQPFELAATIMISELAAIPMQNTGIPLINGIIPILSLLLFQVVISYSSIKNRKIEEFICGKPSLLVENGKINEQNMRKELYTLNDLLEQLRLKNNPNLADVEFAILETNGDLSVIPQTSKRPPNISDLNISSIHEGLTLPVIIEGNILPDNLKRLNISEDDLNRKLNDSGITSTNNILFASLNDAGELFHQFKESNISYKITKL